MLYTVLFTIAIPVVLLRLLWKSRRQPAYRQRWLERFGFFKPPLQTGGLWVHAVSMGETLAAIAIIKRFQSVFPEIPITLTTTTPTGSERVKTLLGESVFHVYFPYDLPFCIKNFLKRVQPKIGMILETELWPNCLYLCKQHSVPIMIVNACLSEKSMRGYRRILSLTRPMMECVSVVAAQSIDDGKRFVELGLNPNRLKVTGNVKFDIIIPEDIAFKAKTLKQLINNRSVLIAASTHHNEEEQVLESFVKIREKFPTALLILVPRHPERFKTVANLVQSKGFSMALRSQSNQNTHTLENVAVYLGDTMGELLVLYAASTIAFVGGSLVSIGGHNVLEAAFMSLPILVGPHVDNIAEICTLLGKVSSLKQIQNSREMAEIVIEWFNHPQLCKEMGQNGRSVVEQNRGAIDKTLTILKDFF